MIGFNKKTYKKPTKNNNITTTTTTTTTKTQGQHMTATGIQVPQLLPLLMILFLILLIPPIFRVLRYQAFSSTLS